MNDYEISLETGEVKRKGEVIAIFEPTSETLTYKPNCRRYAPGVAKFLKAKSLYTEEMKIVEEPSAEKQVAAAIEEIKEEQAAAAAPQPETTETETVSHETETEVIEAEEKTEGIPPCPPETPWAGDKEPAHLEWNEKYMPKDEFIKKYAGRKTHKGILQPDGNWKPLPQKKKKRGTPIALL